MRSGDTLGEIAQERRVSTRELIRWNRLKPPYTVYAGKLLRVARPDGKAVADIQGGRKRGAKGRQAPKSPSTRSAPAASAAPAKPAKPAKPGSRAAGSGVTWVWPLHGALRQGFRAGDRTRQGLRIACRGGEPVRAAGAGQVVYGGSGLKGYGNLIILKHNENYLSAYGFNRRLFAKEGDSVKRGQTVAECGQGPDGAYLLHFEVRRDGAAVDPILYLPPRP